MTSPPPPPRHPGDPSDDSAEFHLRIKSKSERKLKARREQELGPWFGFKSAGIVGWSIAIPTFLGAVLGLWIDSRWDTPYSWTLMLLLLGVVGGCLNAWYWIQQESRDE